ncbi:MAG: helix-turn-helix domain-containing GNAT family N-acetyltransferase [Rhizobiaceae bacterium]
MANSLNIAQIDELRTSARQIVRELGFMQNQLAGTELSPSAVHTLIELGRGSVTDASALRDLLHLEKSSISRLLMKLEADGLVKVEIDPNDKRARTIVLTPKGTILLRQIEEFARGQLHAALSPLSEADLRSIESGFSCFATALSSRDKESKAIESRIDIREGYQSGLIASVTELHASFYSKNYEFGSAFERKVATELSEFIGRVEQPMNTIISAYAGDQLLGSVSLDGEDLGGETAHLRWFVVSPTAQGLGIGKMLFERATTFVDEQGFQQTHLWTFQGLDAARHIYERSGFKLVEEKPGTQWGTKVMEQKFIRKNLGEANQSV